MHLLSTHIYIPDYNTSFVNRPRQLVAIVRDGAAHFKVGGPELDKGMVRRGGGGDKPHANVFSV